MTQRNEPSDRTALIGENIAVTEAQNTQLIGIRGKVIDETKNTIIIENEQGTKTIIKSQVTIEVKNKKIKGQNLLGRIEARIKH